MTIVVRRHLDLLDRDGPPGAAEVCVVLLHLGGPLSLESVEPFYVDDWSGPGSGSGGFSLQSRRDAARQAFEAVRDQLTADYQRLGGGSPVNDLVSQQARALENCLCHRPVMAASRGGRFRVFPGFRFGTPDIASAVAAARETGADRVIGIPLYSLPAVSTTGACVPEFQKACEQHGYQGRNLVIEPFSERPEFQGATAVRLRRTLDLIPEELRAEAAVLFSVVSEPLGRKGIARFLEQVEAAAQAILAGAGVDESRSAVAFLDRGGPGRWLEPALRAVAAARVEGGNRALVVLPLGWVTDDFETLHELDMRVPAELSALGIEKYRRVPLFNADPEFIQLLAQFVTERLGEAS
ncbi:MAG: ferrochelatase [Planctomycetota bacterium]